MIDRVCAAAFTQKRPRPAYPDREDWTSRSLDKRHNGLRAIPLVSLTTIHGQRRRVAVAGDDAVTGCRGVIVSLKAVASFTLLPNYPQIDPEKLGITLDGSER